VGYFAKHSERFSHDAINRYRPLKTSELLLIEQLGKICYCPIRENRWASANRAERGYHRSRVLRAEASKTWKL